MPRQVKARPAQQAAKSEPAAEHIESKYSRESLAISDEILDEIDSVLEENAKDFVQSFVQKGGE